WHFFSRLGIQPRFSPTGESFEDRRRAMLRQGSSTYRLFEPLVDWVAGWAGGSLARRDAVGRQLQAAGERLPWQPGEPIALRQVEGAVVGTAVLLLLGLVGNLVAGALLGIVVAFVLPPVFLSDLGRRGRKRLALLKRRLPFAIDLMALMMEAGAGVFEALGSAGPRGRGHPPAGGIGRRPAPPPPRPSPPPPPP